MLCHLHGSHAHTAAGAQNQDGLSCFQIAAFDKGVPGGRSSGLPAGAFVEGKGWGQGGDGGFPNNPLFRQRAALAPCHHPVTGLYVLYIRGDLDHFSRRFETGDEGRIRPELIFALGHQQVGEV